MYKLVVLFEQPFNEMEFQENWQIFMGLAEKMPRLRKEIVSNVQQVVHASDGRHFTRIHELLFDSRDALETALQSKAGQEAGQFLQNFTSGRMVLLTSEHMEAGEQEFKK